MRAVRTGILLLLFPLDALAWGLQSHLFFAHYALLALPLAHPELRAAAARLPGLVLAGACLPDLAMIGTGIGTPAFARTHQWSTLRRIAAAPVDDVERALVVGYASHLAADVEAHNAFVPEWEGRLGRVPHAVHALCEWAMDHYLRRLAPAQPREVLAAHHAEACAFVASRFPGGSKLAQRALRLLERADGLLRASPLPRLCSGIARLTERRVEERFEDYLGRTRARMAAMDGALSGQLVDWVASDPEGRACDQGADRGAGEDVARIMQSKHHA
jgi:hypothetical protein